MLPPPPPHTRTWVTLPHLCACSSSGTFFYPGVSRIQKLCADTSDSPTEIGAAPGWGPVLFALVSSLGPEVEQELNKPMIHEPRPLLTWKHHALCPSKRLSLLLSQLISICWNNFPRRTNAHILSGIFKNHSRHLIRPNAEWRRRNPIWGMVTGEITTPTCWEEGNEEAGCEGPQRLLNTAQEVLLPSTGGV